MCLPKGIRLKYAYNMMRHEPLITNKKLIRIDKAPIRQRIFKTTPVTEIPREAENRIDEFILEERRKKEARAEKRRIKQAAEESRKKRVHQQKLEWMAEKTRIAKEEILKKEAYALKKLENAGFIKADNGIIEEVNLESIARYYVVRDGVLVEVGILKR